MVNKNQTLIGEENMSDREEYIKLKQALEDIVALVNNNHMDIIPGLKMLARNAKEALKIVNLYDKWRLNVRADQLINSYQIEYGIGIGTYSDIPNGPKIEPTELLKISFPTGAYIFGEDYDTELFKEFYKKLHDVTPAYEDELNHALYYTDDNGSEAYEHYLQTYKKYNEMYKDRSKQRRIKELEKELKMLKQ